jgi:DNA-binding NtrC family response regulator
MIILHPGETVSGEILQTYLDTGKTEPTRWSYSLAKAERNHIEFVLKQTKGRLGGKQGAASLLGIPRTTLQYRLKKHGIDPGHFSSN